MKPFLRMFALVAGLLVIAAGLSAQRRPSKIFVNVVDRRTGPILDQIAAHQREMSTQYEVDFISESKDPQAMIVVHVAREGVSIGLSAGRPIK